MTGRLLLLIGLCGVQALYGAEPATAPATAAAQAASPQQHFDVSEYRVLGNTVLKPVQIERLLYPLLGPSKTLSDVQAARAALEKLYHDQGYGATYVDIPPQDVTDGIVRLHVTEGRIERSEIGGARYFSERDIIVRIPAAKPGTVLKLPDLQRQVNAINLETPDRSVVPVLKAGTAPGTVDLSLKVQDDLPLHGSLELNNQATIDTRPLRAVVGLSYGDLFGRLDNLALQYQTTPQQLDQVKIIAANYAAHPWFADVQPSFFYINSNSNVATVGALGVLGKGQIAGTRFAVPLMTTSTAAQSVTFGLDYKDFRNTVSQNGATALVTPIDYVNLSVAYAGSWRTDERITTMSVAADAGPRGFVNNSQAFANDRFQGRANYFYLRGDLATTFRLPESLSLRVRVAGQDAFEPLISNEDYSIAGIDGVRGYLEAEQLGDTAVKGTVQLQSPEWQRHNRQLGDLYTFYDAGRVEFIDALPGQPSHEVLRSFGGGLNLLPGGRVTGSLVLARPLVTASVTHADIWRVLFVIRGTF